MVQYISFGDSYWPLLVEYILLDYHTQQWHFLEKLFMTADTGHFGHLSVSALATSWGEGAGLGVKLLEMCPSSHPLA